MSAAAAWRSRFLAAGLVVWARRRLGHRDRVGTRKAILKPNIQRILEHLLVARLLLAPAPDVRFVLEIIIMGQGGSMPVVIHFLALPYADGRKSAALALSLPG
jgi:hypothetical protein